MRAVDRLRKAQRQRAAARALRPGEQVSVTQTLVGNMPAQQANRPLMSQHAPIVAGRVHAVIVAQMRARRKDNRA